MSFLEMQVTTKVPDVDAAVDVVMEGVLDEAKNEAKRSLLTPKHGTAYFRGADVHHASAPGEAPADDTGDLYDSIDSMQVGDVGYITASAPYADYLEHGTSRMAPRPFMGPAARKAVESSAKFAMMFKARMEA